MPHEKRKFVSRAGEKLDAAIEAFGLDMTGVAEAGGTENPTPAICADFGCNVGGFTDCMLRRGAEKVFAVDTGYGELAWTLRKDPRVVVMERTNALYTDAPQLVDFVTIDVAWTPLKLIVPAAAKWLKPGGKIIALLKPHFELAKIDGKKPHAALADEKSQSVALTVQQQLAENGAQTLAAIVSPLRGKGGNCEFLLLIEPAAEQ
ncbi:MAG: TlyA family rRNA (cytidine-2'-O)-methyltransferase [Phycisphaerae bacterium]|nr:TlyA family rRNA (cytidine-2'-O)-methyltransferase [Phycisphaerae bacterium]